MTDETLRKIKLARVRILARFPFFAMVPINWKPLRPLFEDVALNELVDMKKKSCESCGDKITTPSKEDPDLCQDCFDSIFSGPGITIQLTSMSDLAADLGELE